MIDFKSSARRAACLLAMCLAPFSAGAQDFPSRTVRILTPFPAGAGPDGAVRLLADKLQKAWGKPVIVDNRPGGNGFIAIDAFKRGASDGHDLIQLDNVHLAAYPALFKKLPYDPARDFEVLAPLFRAYFFVAVPSSSSYKSMAELIADARARPGQLNYGSWSIGNPVHLGSALVESMTGTQMQHVVFKEVSQLYTAVGTGELNWALGTAASAGPMQRAGKLRFIAISAPKRQAAFPDIPTIAETPGLAGYEMTGWTALAVPRSTPKAVADKIYRDIEAALAEPDFKDRYATYGYELFPTSREQFQAFIASESAKLSALIQRAKVSLD
ncbi:tripartite tricarboxylate transporter substrate binding protein [Roseateles sp.]|uniref:Bug family tripartite tricarboxylate transporter substrate binding protein n=1 Tax=Roseateles sp. TaxID=1971397 RepID=UPI003266EB52